MWSSAPVAGTPSGKRGISDRPGSGSAVGDGARADPLSRPPRAAPQSGRSVATARGRADPPGGPVREPLPEPGGRSKSGENRWTALIGRLDRQIGTGEDDRARATIRAVVNGPDLDEFLWRAMAYARQAFPPTVRRVSVVRLDTAIKAGIGQFPAAVLSDTARSALTPMSAVIAVPTRLVRLSAESAIKQVINHSDLTTADYRLLPDLIERGAVSANNDGRHVTVLREFEGVLYLAVVKQTAANELFLKSFHKIGKRDVPRALRRSRGAGGSRPDDSTGSAASLPEAHGGASRPAGTGNPT